MILFLPSFFFPNFGDGNTNTGTVGNSSTDTNTTVGPGDIQFDIFNAVVFIVAGPAIGFTMSQAVIFFSFLIFFQDKYKFLLAYCLSFRIGLIISKGFLNHYLMMQFYI